MTAAGITTSQFADELRKVFSVEDGLWRDVQNRDLASAQKRFDTLFELSEGLPGDVRQNVRIKLEKVRHRLDYPLKKIREISDEKQRNHSIGKIIGEAIWNWFDGQKLQQVAYELAAWLPATTPPGHDAAGVGQVKADGRRVTGKNADKLEGRVARLESKIEKKLRSDQAFLQKRLDFCCSKRTKTPPDSWHKIYDAYQKKFPKDTTANAGSLRLTHTRHCPKCKKQGGQ